MEITRNIGGYINFLNEAFLIDYYDSDEYKKRHPDGETSGSFDQAMAVKAALEQIEADAQRLDLLVTSVDRVLAQMQFPKMVPSLFKHRPKKWEDYKLRFTGFPQKIVEVRFALHGKEPLSSWREVAERFDTRPTLVSQTWSYITASFSMPGGRANRRIMQALGLEEFTRA